MHTVKMHIIATSWEHEASHASPEICYAPLIIQSTPQCRTPTCEAASSGMQPRTPTPIHMHASRRVDARPASTQPSMPTCWMMINTNKIIHASVLFSFISLDDKRGRTLDLQCVEVFLDISCMCKYCWRAHSYC